MDNKQGDPRRVRSRMNRSMVAAAPVSERQPGNRRCLWARPPHGRAIVLSVLGLLAVLALGTACGGRTTFLHPEADMSFYEKVGVIPFATLGDDRLAGDKLSSAFTSHLLFARQMQVAEPGQFLAAFVKQFGAGNPPPIGLPQDKLAAVAQETGVQGIFEGTVRDFDFTRGTPPRPMISVEVRLVDVASGNIVWSTSITRVGKPIIPFLGLGGARTLAELTEDVATELVARLPQ
jgi:polysaccharide biosynthesis protein PelC